GIAGLMHSERVKKAFDDDHRPDAGLEDSREIEEDERFAEARRKAILRFVAVDGASCIRDQRAVLVVDRNHDATAQKAATLIEADAKRVDGLLGQAAAGQIWVTLVDVLQREAQRRIRRRRCRVLCERVSARGKSAAPVLQPKRGVAYGAALHERNEIEDVVATHIAAARLHARLGAAGPHVT